MQEPDANTSHAVPASHSPQSWFRQSLSPRSVPNLFKQRSNRSLGISSIKDLARSPRKPLAPLSTNHSQTSTHALRASNSLYGTLRDQCKPPPPPAIPELPASSGSVLRRSQSSSADSFIPDQSGFSNLSSHPTTVSPARHSSFFEGSPPLSPGSMGNKASTIARNPLPLRTKKSQADIESGKEKENEKSPAISYELNPESRPPPATYSPRGSSVQVQVPRRRSSLTVLHLDKSHFEAVNLNQPVLSHRSSTLTEPRDRRSSTTAETIRPVISNTSTLKPLNTATNRERTLSPPLFSPNSQLSSASSRSVSFNEIPTSIRSSVIGSRIHLPKTFPEGIITIRAPNINKTHHTCYTNHKTIQSSSNRYYPVPCMTCGDNAFAQGWTCAFCYLRICPRCMDELARRKKNLQDLMSWLNATGKDEEGMKEVVPDKRTEKEVVDHKEDVEKQMEESALKKVETTRKRETR